MRSLRTTLLAAALAVPSLSFAQTTAATYMPAQMNAAAFVNVGKILEEYGMLFDGGPLAEQLDQFVAMGMPDPRTEDLREVAFGGTVEGLDDDKFSIYVTRGEGGQPDFAKRIAEFIAGTGRAGVSEEAYRGATLYTLSDADQGDVVKMADINGSASFASVDSKALHAFANLTIETANGANTNFAAKYGSQLQTSDYAAVSFEMPKELRDELKQTQLNFLSLIVHARARLSSEEGEVRLAIDGVCIDEDEATALRVSLKKAFEELRQQIPGGDDEWGFILDSVQFTQDGNTTTVSVALPEDLVKDLLGAFTGQEMVD